MDSPIIKWLTVVMGWPLIVLAAIVVFELYLALFYLPTIGPPNRQRIQHPGHHPGALEALARYRALPAAEQTAIRDGLGAAMVPVETWIDGLGEAELRLLCLGENHDDHTRRFLADSFFSRFEADALLLETTPRELVAIRRRIARGSSYVPLLDADIAAVINAAVGRNPDLLIRGVEELPIQMQRHRRGVGSREQSIARNIAHWLGEDWRHVVLIGALHCKDLPQWLYRTALAEIPGLTVANTLNVRVLGEHQDGPLEAFVYFLDEIGLEPGDFAIPDTASLPRPLRQWFLLLWDQTMGPYRALVVFRPPPVASRLSEPTP